MRSRTYLGTYVFIFVIGLMFHNSLTLCGSELIEVNRVAARVNDRIVTWGEIDKAMDRLNFPENEKIKRASEFLDGKIDRLLSIVAFSEKGMAIPDSFIEQEYNRRLIQEFNGDRKLFRDVLKSKGQSQLEYREEIKEEIIYGHMLATRKRMKEEISTKKVEAFYQKNPSMFRTSEKVRIREIEFTQIADEPVSVLCNKPRRPCPYCLQAIHLKKLQHNTARVSTDKTGVIGELWFPQMKSGVKNCVTKLLHWKVEKYLTLSWLRNLLVSQMAKSDFPENRLSTS